MRKIFALLALVLGVVSCQTEPEGFDATVGGEKEVNITVALPEATRSDSAVGAFGNVNFDLYDVRFQCEVHYKGEKKTLETQISDNGKTATFPVRLIPGRDYTFVVWADLVLEGSTADLHYTTTNTNGLADITLKGEWNAMDDTRDAYTCAETHKFLGDGNISLTLTRPFAKLRVKTTDMHELLGVDPAKAKVTYSTDHYTSYDAVTKTPSAKANIGDHDTLAFDIVEYTENEGENKKTLFADYFFAKADQEVVNFTLEVMEENGTRIIERTFNTPIPVKRNTLTTIEGNILTYGDNITVTIEDEFAGSFDETLEGETTATVATTEDFISAVNSGVVENIVLTGDINLNDLLTRAAAADPSLTIAAGKTLSIDLNGKKLSATSTQTGKNYNMFNVKGTLSLANGTIEYEHKGENMGWGASTNLFDVTAGGVLNLDGVTAKNLGGSDMGFVAHLNNWGEVTLNVENSTLESNYVAVRVFNSGPDMNNVTIKNSTLKGVSAAFWVHNFTAADFGSEAKAEAQKALLNFNIYNQGNTFSPDLNGVRYGFTNSVRADAYGITKSVSEDGTVVTLGSMAENGLIRRGVAGDEENTTIKKVVVEEGVGVLYDRTFRRFYALEEVVLPSTLTTIGAAGSGVFQSCTNLKNIVLPESLTVLGKGSFQECSSLESINIPAGVTRIESDALRATGLKSVEFHAGVTYFGAQAFRDCKQLTEVIINAPEFTMEGNTFGIMAAPFTPMTIYVANAEMKTYVESMLTAHAKTYITVVAPKVVESTEGLKAALATEGAKMVTVAAGEYTFPTSSVKAGQTIICEEGAVFTGLSKLNIKGATVVGATFSNPNGMAVDQTISGTFKDCTFEGNETLRWCYTTAGDVVVFENCVVKTTKRGIHFDGMDGDVIFRNCEINGFNAYSGKGTITFENCTFGSDASNYNGLNIYSHTNLVNCTFNFVSGKTNFIDMEGTAKTLTITNCTATLDGEAANVADFVGGSKLAENTVIIK